MSNDPNSIPAKSDGVSTIVVHVDHLPTYLQELRRVENFVPLTPVTDSTKYVTIVSRGSKTPQFLIEVKYPESEEG